jgi:anti-sigma B factor antagonist
VSRLDWESEQSDAVAFVTLRGELDVLSVGELEPELDRLAEEPGVEIVVLDLRGLEFLDSGGLRLTILTERRLRGVGRRLVLVRGPLPVQRVFEITRMTDRLAFVDAPDQVARER